MITLALNNISKSYGVEQIIENITFSVNEYEKIGLVGMNGAGKSTLFKLIAKELYPDSGDIYISKKLLSDILSKMFVLIPITRCTKKFWMCSTM